MNLKQIRNCVKYQYRHFRGRIPQSSSYSNWPPDVSESLVGQKFNKKGFDGIDNGLKAIQTEQLLDKYLRGVLDAQGTVYDIAKETSLTYASGLSQLLENHIYIKREDEQPVHSFKIRGAYNKLFSLSEEKRAKVNLWSLLFIFRD